MRATVPRLLLVFALSLPCSIALAQPTAPSLESARRAFGDASTAFGRGDYEQALKLFRLAFESAPRDAVRFNIGVCLEQLGRYDEARNEYEQAASSTSLSATELEDARRRADALIPLTSEIIVTQAGPDTPLKIDDVDRCRGAGCRIFVLPGSHRVEIQVKGSPHATTVEAKPGTRTEVHVAIEDAPKAPVPPPPTPMVTKGRAGWLTGVGSAVAGIGTAGVIGFGIRANDLHREYLANPTAEERSSGLTMRNLSNASIAVLSVGAVLVVVDLAFAKTGQHQAIALAPDGYQISF